MRLRTRRDTPGGTLPAILLAGILLAVAACGQGGAGTGRAAARQGEGGGTLTIWTDDKRAPALKAAADRFSKETGVTVKIQTVPGETRQVDFVTASQGGKAPDLVMGAHDWIGNLVRNGAIDPITMTEDQKAAFNSLALKGVTFDGQIYGIPFALENVVLFRNTALAPQAPKSFEELVAAGKRLKSQGKVSEVLAFPVGQNGDAYYGYPLYTAGGGYLFGQADDGDYDPGDLGLAEPGAAEAMENFAKYGEKGEGVLKRSIGTDNVASVFTGGKSAFLVGGPWFISEIQKAGIAYDISPVPGFGDTRAKPFVGVQALFVASKGPSKVLAQEFATNYFAQPDVALAFYRADPRPPALIAAFDEAKTTDQDLPKLLSAGEGGDIMPAIPAMNAVWDPWGKAIAAVVGGADPAGTTQAAAETIRSAIE
ncbi:sugar ABC transporter substrate-binding protein [Planobispora takensis]|uniref:Sugar ABC transporter substrate-binding protein n=1 Tax=Planobispora takensis TaxID=1367882 RepID=A0A8J3STC6_9ACTN|nr:maltose ABC transporter substrate-binding protein [Planobispora takensis]GII00167.1 sugar ABC transporter substrate-binding protein [Planobispora takensis]